MALTVEDGTVVSGADSYITVAQFKTWADARGFSYGTDEVVEQNIRRAMDFLDGKYFIGDKLTEAQALQWPRLNVEVDGYYVDSDEIPAQLVAALYEIAYAESSSLSELAAVGRKTLQKTVGPISITYANNSASRTISPAIAHALRKLTRNTMAVSRA